MVDLARRVSGRYSPTSPLAAAPSTLQVFTGEGIKARDTVTADWGLLSYAQSLPLIVDTAWNTNDEDGWQYVTSFGKTPTIITDGTAPNSPSNVVEINFADIDPDSDPLKLYIALSSITELYVEYWIKISTNFPASSAGMFKTTYMYESGGGSAWFGVVCANSGGSCTLDATTGPLMHGIFYAQWPPYLPAGDNNVLDHTLATTFNRGEWVKLAQYYKTESNVGTHSGDGQIAWWTNNILQRHLTNRSNNLALTEFQFAPVVQNADLTGLNATIVIDHLTMRGQ